MSNNGDSAQDLQSILATLAALGNSQAQQNSAAQAPHIPHPAPNDQPRPTPQSRNAASANISIDPATITTWKDGLRCVTKIAAQNERFAQSIRELIAQQRSHELKWYQERQDLKKRQAQRAQSSAKALSILSNLNQSQAAISTSATPLPSESLEEEMLSFDRKTYAAQKSLDEHHERVLQGLGVPFFGTESTLILSDAAQASNLDLPNDRPSWSPVVKESELLELRRRMVEHLENLYRDGPP